MRKKPRIRRAGCPLSRSSPRRRGSGPRRGVSAVSPEGEFLASCRAGFADEVPDEEDRLELAHAGPGGRPRRARLRRRRGTGAARDRSRRCSPSRAARRDTERPPSGDSWSSELLSGHGTSIHPGPGLGFGQTSAGLGLSNIRATPSRTILARPGRPCRLLRPPCGLGSAPCRLLPAMVARLPGSGGTAAGLVACVMLSVAGGHGCPGTLDLPPGPAGPEPRGPVPGAVLRPPLRHRRVRSRHPEPRDPRRAHLPPHRRRRGADRRIRVGCPSASWAASRAA